MQSGMFTRPAGLAPAGLLRRDNGSFNTNALMMSDHSTAGGGSDPLAAYGYSLPQELIAQKPADRRVKARLLVMEPQGGLTHSRIFRLGDWLEPGDLLVMNDTKVVPARIPCLRDTGGKAELLLLNPARPDAKEPDGVGTAPGPACVRGAG